MKIERTTKVTRHAKNIVEETVSTAMDCTIGEARELITNKKVKVNWSVNLGEVFSVTIEITEN